MKQLEIKNLKVHFPIRAGFWRKAVGYNKAVDDVSLQIEKGQIYSLVGESGSGKSTLGNAALGLTAKTSGQIFWEEQEVFGTSTSISTEARRKFQMIYQDSHSSLNPRRTIFEILSQPMLYHKICNPDNVEDSVVELLEQVKLDASVMSRFPHEFSGGQRQRINIARTLGVEPQFIVCDEIVSALDVSIQGEILNLIQDIQAKKNLTILFIGHDLAVVKQISDQIGVMYQGKLVETGTPDEIFNHTQNTYTKTLIDAVPSLKLEHRKRGK